MNIYDDLSSQQWWEEQRSQYKRGLIIAGIIAFICEAFMSEMIIAYNPQFEFTILTIIVQGIGFLIMLWIANRFYNLGHWVDRTYNKNNSERFRNRLFNLGYWFSVCLLLMIPISIIIQYLYYKK